MKIKVSSYFFFLEDLAGLQTDNEATPVISAAKPAKAVPPIFNFSSQVVAPANNFAASPSPPSAFIYFLILMILEAANRLLEINKARAALHFAILDQFGSATIGKALVEVKLTT